MAAPPPPPWPQVWAHRCGGRLAPENSLAGIAQALALDCRGIEFDVMLSADGVPVLIHDETVDRSTDGRGRVAELTAAQLARLDAGIRWGAQWTGEPIPTLEQALAAADAGALFVNVELKPARGFDTATGHVVAATVARLMAGREGRLVLSSFSEAALEAARATAPQLPRGLLAGRAPADWEARCRRLGCVALHVDQRHLSAPLAARVKTAGLRLVSYTENDLAHARRCRAWGVDALITDWPDRIREAALSPPETP
jgi:glycerophosphoryl diester phosphodiesterase